MRFVFASGESRNSVLFTQNVGKFISTSVFIGRYFEYFNHKTSENTLNVQIYWMPKRFVVLNIMKFWILCSKQFHSIIWTFFFFLFFVWIFSFFIWILLLPIQFQRSHNLIKSDICICRWLIVYFFLRFFVPLVYWKLEVGT